MKHKYGILCVLVHFITLIAHGQTSQSGLVSAFPGGGATSNFYYARAGDITILVELWGAVQRPGRYEIATTINLIHLLSLAGGPSEEGRIDNIKITRMVNTDSHVKWKTLSIDLDELTEVKESDIVLHPGDIIYVQKESWSIWRQGVNQVTPILSLALVAFQVIILLTR